MDTLASRLLVFARRFDGLPPVFTSTAFTQENHANQVTEWLELTESLADAYPSGNAELEKSLDAAYQGARCLFYCGDDITAWLGQLNVAAAAERHFSGDLAAYHCSIAARFSAYMKLTDEAEMLLIRMYQQLTSGNPALLHIYWELWGLIHSQRRMWLQAMNDFQKSLQYIHQSSLDELSRWVSVDSETLIANRMLHISDCWISLGWQAEGKDRAECAEKAQNYLKLIRDLPRVKVEEFMTELNTVEVMLLSGDLPAARQILDELLNYRNQASPRIATAFPLTYCLEARYSWCQEDETAMITNLSRALAESNLYPHALQEFQIVDYALGLLQTQHVTRETMEPLFQAMVTMLEAKDWYTGHGHSKTVAGFSLALWDTWQRHSDESIRENLYWASYLHDIGKLKLPRSLLSKVAKLTDREFGLLRLHSQFSQEILEGFSVPLIATWAGEHHQDARGLGYPGYKPASPMGLCIAVADILEAATSPGRLYRKPKSMRDIIAELREMGEERYPAGLVIAIEHLCPMI